MTLHRKVGKLIVVAGPSCAGKSTFIQKLQADMLPSISRQLQLGDALSWKCLSAQTLVRNSKQTDIARLILHYDFLRPWTLNGKNWEDDEALAPLRTADDIALVTIWATPERLFDRIDAELVAKESRYQKPGMYRLARGIVSTAFKKGLRKSMKNVIAGKYSSHSLHTWIKKHRKVRRLYEDPAIVVHFYTGWFAFCESRGLKKHWILNGAGEAEKLTPLSEWTGKMRDPDYIYPTVRTPR